MALECRRTHLMDRDGTFNADGLDSLVREVGLVERGISYTVVSIMGPQSSGKSTLLNHLFGTNFKEMDAYEGRSQTTKGIWMAECAGIEPCTLVMDLEGSDGRERGEDNAFEKQIALFALAVSDIVLINMWCHDIGREQAANRPLLKIVFQEMTKLFSPHKTTLMFVIRDKTRSPMEKLEPILRKDIQEIWDSVPKPENHKETPLSDFFNVKVVALSSFEMAEGEFKHQIASLKQQFFHSKSPGGLAGDRQGLVPSSAFSISAHEMWKVIKDNKNLDLPTHKILVATLQCQEIADEIFNSFVTSKDWCQLKESVKTLVISVFGERLTSIFDTRLSEYDKKAVYFDDGVNCAKRKELEDKLLLLVQPVFMSMWEHSQSETLNNFKEAFKKELKNGGKFSTVAHACTQSFLKIFDSRCADASFRRVNWDESRNKFQLDIDAHIGAVRNQKLRELITSYQKMQNKLSEVLPEKVGILLHKADRSTWPKIGTLFLQETASAVSGISSELSSFDVDEQFTRNMPAKLKEYARGVVVSKIKDEAGKILILMKNRFIELFNHDSKSNPRAWTEDDDIEGIKKAAYTASVELLACLAAIRLDDCLDDKVDRVLATLTGALLEDTAFHGRLLILDTWEEIPLSSTLITPIQCKSIWLQFIAETEFMVTQATASQNANKRRKKAARIAERLLVVGSAIVTIVAGLAGVQT